MDNINTELLAALKKNARMSVKELSLLINLSQPATSQRLKKLEEEGFIQGYTVVLNPDKFNRKLISYCLIVLKLKDMDSEEKFRSYVDNMEDIEECYCIAGPYEYLIKIVTESSQSLEVILADLRKKYDIKSHTYPVLSTVKRPQQPAKL